MGSVVCSALVFNTLLPFSDVYHSNIYTPTLSSAKFFLPYLINISYRLSFEWVWIYYYTAVLFMWFTRCHIASPFKSFVTLFIVLLGLIGIRVLFILCLRRTLCDVYMIYQESHCWCIGEPSNNVPYTKYFVPITQYYHCWIILYWSLSVLVLSFLLLLFPKKWKKQKTKFNYGFYCFYKDPFLMYKESRAGQQHQMVTGRSQCGKFTYQKCISMFLLHVCTVNVK